MRIPVRELGLMDSGQVIEIDDPYVMTPRQAVAAVQDFYKYAHREVAVMIALDAEDKIIDTCRLMVGSIDHVPIRPRIVFTEAIARLNASSIILAHNHPTGNVTPSMMDRAFMRKIRDLGEELDCRLADFIILGSDGKYWAATNETYALSKPKPL